MEEKVEELRKEYINNPGKRNIIIRQIRALEIATGKKYLKTPVDATSKRMV